MLKWAFHPSSKKVIYLKQFSVTNDPIHVMSLVQFSCWCSQPTLASYSWWGCNQWEDFDHEAGESFLLLFVINCIILANHTGDGKFKATSHFLWFSLFWHWNLFRDSFETGLVILFVILKELVFKLKLKMRLLYPFPDLVSCLLSGTGFVWIVVVLILIRKAFDNPRHPPSPSWSLKSFPLPIHILSLSQ